MGQKLIDQWSKQVAITATEQSAGNRIHSTAEHGIGIVNVTGMIAASVDGGHFVRRQAE